MKYLKTYKQLFEKRVSKDEKIDIYRDADYIVVAPLTHLASCKYGTDTGWCISVPSASYVWVFAVNGIFKQSYTFIYF
jgi:hypothetical protein